MIKGLQILIQKCQQSKEEFEKYKDHKLKRITFMKPQEFSGEVQFLEEILQEKQSVIFSTQLMRRQESRRLH